MFDVALIRDDFPILRRRIHGRPLVYLDNGATTQKPARVIQALVEFYEQHNANVHRGVHTLSQEATDIYEEVRSKTARFLNADSEEQIIFTRGTTESINLVAQAWAREHLQTGDEIVLTVLEHHSNLVPWQIVAGERGASLRFVPLTPAGMLDMDAAATLIGPRTRLVAVAQVSNVLGTITPVKRLAELAHAQGAVLLVDGAQSAPHLPVDVKALDCDFFACSAHKMLGPTGVGVLYGRRNLLQSMVPYQSGGSMIARVELNASTYAGIPTRFEAGTPNFADVAAFGAALDYLNELGMEEVLEHERALTAYALDRLATIPRVTVFGPCDPSERTGAIAFNYGDLHPHDVGMILDHYGVAVRAGHHCAQPLMRFLGVPATVRASTYVYNNTGDIDALIAGLESVGAHLKSDALDAAPTVAG